jgi:mono/diheme cytochrome c family protein
MKPENALRNQPPTHTRFFLRVPSVLRGRARTSATCSRLLVTSLVFVQALILVSAQGKTTLDGIYTEAQAKRGETIYTDSCASCHGPDLSGGGQTPGLAGKDFNMDWNDLSMSDLFERTRATMPADAPGRLKTEQAADVIAFLLQKGDFPAGQTELPADIAALKAIKFVSPKP